MTKKTRIAVVGVMLFAMSTIGMAAALADSSAGNSGHSNNGSTQCQAGGQDHCPPFGP
jgi:Spy/CpxP family protein refolding chaperone